MKSNEELNKKYQEFFNESATQINLETNLKAESPVSESIELLKPKKMVGPISEEEFDEMFKEFL